MRDIKQSEAGGFTPLALIELFQEIKMTFTKRKQMSLKLRTKYSLEARLYYARQWLKQNGADILAGLALGLALMIYGAV